MAEEVNIRNEEPRPPARATYEVEEYRRVSWGAIWGGVVVSFGFALLFALFGLFIGFAGWNPVTGGGGGPWGFAWNIVTGFFAVFFGAWAAAALAGYPSRRISMLHGLATWGLFSGFLALFVGFVLTGTLQALLPAAAAAAPVVAAPGAAPAAVTSGAISIAHGMWVFWLTAWLGIAAGLIGALIGANIGRPKEPMVRGEVRPEWRRAA